MSLIDKIPLLPLILFSVTLGLAPFYPQPHLFEKLGMLFTGTLTRPIDIFDLIMHATPVALLIIKLLAIASKRFT